MRRFWSSFAAAAVGAVFMAGSAAAGGFAPGAAPAPGGYGPIGGGYGPNCGAPGFGGPGYGHGGPGFGYGYRPAPPPPICTTQIEWQTTYRTEQRCHETWREVSIPISRSVSVPGACGPGQACQPDVFRIKVPHCEPRTVTVPVSNPVKVTVCRQPDANSCGVVGEPLEDRRWDRHGGWDGKWDGRWDGRWDDRRSDWRPAPAPVYNPTPSYAPAPVFAPSYVGPTTNYRSARAGTALDVAADPAPATSTFIGGIAPKAPVGTPLAASAPTESYAAAPGGETQWLSQ